MKASSKKNAGKIRLLAISVTLFLLLGCGATMWLSQNAAAEANLDSHRQEAVKPPVFVALDPFTINLQPEYGEQFLQVSFTVQLASNDQQELFKLYMPEVRSRALLLLAGKRASEIATTAGKNKLSEELLTELNHPFKSLDNPQMVSAVFFTSFVIQ